MKTFKTKGGTELPLLDLRGKDYLVVAQRLVWFREEHPDWSIETEITRFGEGGLGKATIKDSSGRIMATSHKFEDPKGFQDWIEKCETGAVGRALALCGYGTQFAPELSEGERIVDSPISLPTPLKTYKPGVLSETKGFCDICKAGLRLSKSGERYYCPNFKDESLGKHTVVDTIQMDAFLESRKDIGL